MTEIPSIMTPFENTSVHISFRGIIREKKKMRCTCLTALEEKLHCGISQHSLHEGSYLQPAWVIETAELIL